MLINLDGNIKPILFCKFVIQDPFVHGPTDTFCFFSFLVHFDVFYTGDSFRQSHKGRGCVEFSAVNCILKYILHTVQGGAPD